LIPPTSVEIEEPEDASTDETTVDVAPPVASEQEELKEGHLTFQENQRGVTFDSLFGPYLKGAIKIVITDPYIRLFYQARNLMEFLETIARQKADEDEVEVRLITIIDEFKSEQQIGYFEQIEATCTSVGIHFSWEFDETNSIHARHIELDNGWKILLDRGLDIFQHYDMNDAFSMINRIQRYRSCKAFEVTYLMH